MFALLHCAGALLHKLGYTVPTLGRSGVVRRWVSCSVELQVWRLLETATMHDRAEDSGFAGGPSGSAGISSQVLASLSCLVLLITALYYSLAEELVPGDRLWQQQSTTLFAQSSLVTSAYW